MLNCGSTAVPRLLTANLSLVSVTTAFTNASSAIPNDPLPPSRLHTTPHRVYERHVTSRDVTDMAAVIHVLPSIKRRLCPNAKNARPYCAQIMDDALRSILWAVGTVRRPY